MLRLWHQNSVQFSKLHVALQRKEQRHKLRALQYCWASWIVVSSSLRWERRVIRAITIKERQRSLYTALLGWHRVVITQALALKLQLAEADAKVTRSELEQQMKEQQMNGQNNEHELSRMIQKLEEMAALHGNGESRLSELQDENTELRVQMGELQNSISKVRDATLAVLDGSDTMERTLQQEQMAREEAEVGLEQVRGMLMELLDAAEKARVEQLQHKDEMQAAVLWETEQQIAKERAEMRREIEQLQGMRQRERENLEEIIQAERGRTQAQIEGLIGRARACEAALRQAEVEHLKALKAAELEVMRVQDNNQEACRRLKVQEGVLATLDRDRGDALSESHLHRVEVQSRALAACRAYLISGK